MESIIAPGRIRYITETKREGCIFCADSLREKQLVLHEGTTCYVIMNKYPYTAGHVMAAPYRHIAGIGDARREELLELMELASRSVKALQAAADPHGFNIGMNLGAAAGAGYASHLHLHVVPRWSGDANFMTVLGETRVIPEEVETTKELLTSFF